MVGFQGQWNDEIIIIKRFQHVGELVMLMQLYFQFFPVRFWSSIWVFLLWNQNQTNSTTCGSIFNFLRRHLCFRFKEAKICIIFLSGNILTILAMIYQAPSCPSTESRRKKMLDPFLSDSCDGRPYDPEYEAGIAVM